MRIKLSRKTRKKGILGRKRCRLEENIKLDIRQTVYKIVN
jgi:hypothetical protein